MDWEQRLSAALHNNSIWLLEQLPKTLSIIWNLQRSRRAAVCCRGSDYMMGAASLVFNSSVSLWTQIQGVNFGAIYFSDDTDKLRLQEEERHLVVQADWLGTTVSDLQLPITCYAIILSEVYKNQCEFCHSFWLLCLHLLHISEVLPDLWIDIALKVSRVIRKEHRSLFLKGSNSPKKFMGDHVYWGFLCFSPNWTYF